MAHLSGGDTLPDDETRPVARPAGSRPWGRHVAVPETAATRGTFWEPDEQVQYPTRMARRRALAAAQILDGWQPDPVLTPPLLERVGDELLRLFDEPALAVDAHVPEQAPQTQSASTSATTVDDDAAPALSRRRRRVLGRSKHGLAETTPVEAAPTPVEATPTPVEPGSARRVAVEERPDQSPADESPADQSAAEEPVATPHDRPRRRRGWRRGGRRHETRRTATPDNSAVSGWDAVAVPSPAPVVRQDDAVDDAAWFAGLKQMAREDEQAVQALPDQVVPTQVSDDQSRPDESRPADEREVSTTALPEPQATSTPADVAPQESATAPTLPPRPPADVHRIVPASPPVSTRPTRRLVAAAVAAVVVVTAGVVLALRSGDDAAPSAGGPAVSPQQAIVVALSLSDQAAAAQTPKPATTKGKKSDAPARQAQAGDVTGLSLLAAGGGSAQQVLVPSRLLLDVPGAGRVPLAQSLLGSPEAPGEAVADALEVKVDTTWALDSEALAALVDRVGGVVVNVDADVTQGTQVGAAVLLGAGPQQKLTGQQAALFAQFLGAEEPEASRLARQEQVLRAVFAALPDDPATIRAIIGDLPGAPRDTALDAVTAVVSATRLAVSHDELASTVLPVTEIDAGGTVVSYGLDDEAADQLVDTRLAGAKLPVAAVGHVRVLVQNGVGTPGLGDVARTKLLAAGLRYVAGGNLPGFGQDETVVLLRDASTPNRERGMAVARALGLGQSSLRISQSAPTIADVVVILGEDFTVG